MVVWILALHAASGPDSAAAQGSWAIEAEHLRGSVYLVSANRGVDRVNLVASIGPDGVLLSDAGVAGFSEALATGLEHLVGGPPRILHIISTHYHGDHTGGNRRLGTDAIVYAHPATDSSLRAGREFGPAPEDARAPDVLVRDSLRLRFNDEDVRILHVPAAHTDGDLVVHFVEADVLHVGDLVLAPRTLPYSRHPNSHADGLSSLSERIGTGTMVATGHGDAVDRPGLHDLAELMRETIDAASAAVRSGTSLQDFLANRPPGWAEWESRFLSVDDWLTRLYQDARDETEPTRLDTRAR